MKLNQLKNHIISNMLPCLHIPTFLGHLDFNQNKCSINVALNLQTHFLFQLRILIDFSQTLCLLIVLQHYIYIRFSNLMHVSG